MRVRPRQDWQLARWAEAMRWDWRLSTTGLDPMLIQRIAARPGRIHMLSTSASTISASPATSV
jgi:hypothetical protein